MKPEFEKFGLLLGDTVEEDDLTWELARIQKSCSSHHTQWKLTGELIPFLILIGTGVALWLARG